MAETRLSADMQTSLVYTNMFLSLLLECLPSCRRSAEGTPYLAAHASNVALRIGEQGSMALNASLRKLRSRRDHKDPCLRP
eukprot:2912579-Amphidinium_carterae.1